MTELYIDLRNASDIREMDISKEIVDATDDVECLHDWHQTLIDKDTEISEFLQAYRLAQIDDEDYFRRTAGKLAYIRIASRWIERRLLSLGETVNYPPTDPRSRQLRILEEKIRKLNARVEELAA